METSFDCNLKGRRMKRFEFGAKLLILVSLTAVSACGPSGSQLVGKWDGTGPESFHCILDIAKNGDNFSINTENFTPGGSGRCDHFSGNYTMTKEGNLVRGAESVVLSFDKSKNKFSNYDFGEWLYFTKVQ
jgi:hypothetical protein